MSESSTCVNCIFEQPWWLEAVAPGQWEAAEIEMNGKVIARLPFYKTKRFGMKMIGMPAYTQTLGYCIKDTGAKNSKKYSRQKDLILELIEKLPKGYSVDLFLDHSCEYLFPFKWKGFRIEMVYSYRIDPITDEKLLWNGLGDNIRREIKKAQKKVTIEDFHPIDDLIDLQNKTFARQGRSINNDALIKRLDSALLEHNARKLLCAVDDSGRIHAASYFVFDENCFYYLIGGSDPDLRNSGAASLLMWEGLKIASDVSKSFDFEGSMIEPIERFFRSFGGKPTPYWRVTKLNLLLTIADYLKPKVKNMIGWK